MSRIRPRIDPHNPDLRVVKDAVKLSRRPGDASRLSRGEAAFFMPETSRTLPVTDGGGVVHTGETFTLGISELGADYVYLGAIPE